MPILKHFADSEMKDGFMERLPWKKEPNKGNYKGK